MRTILTVVLSLIVMLTVVGFGVTRIFKRTDPTIPEPGSEVTSGESLTDIYENSVTGITEAISGIVTSVENATSRTELSSIIESVTERESSSSATSATSGTSASSAPTSAPSSTSQRASETANGSAYEYSYAGYNPVLIEINESNKEMVLINSHYIMSPDYAPETDYAIKGDTSSKKLDIIAAPHYNDMYLAAAKEGIYLTTVSGYRSYALQKRNFDNKINKYMNQGMDKVTATREAAKIILPPGTSEHNLGLAMDIISLEQNFENTKAFRWLVANAQDYGFILRYPKDKEAITEIIYEPWHWRYVGIENAKKIKASGMCLEEYLGKVPS